MEHVDETAPPGAHPGPADSPWRAPTSPAPPPWAQHPQQPPAPWLAEPRGNPAAVWSWVVAVPCAVLGLVLGVLGLVRSRRRGGAGFAHAVVGTVLSVVVLLVSAVGLAAGAVAALVALDGDSAAARTPDGTVASLSQPEQAFIDDLYEETYQAFDDATLLDMAYGFCADMDAGSSPAEADASLVDRWSRDDLTLDAAYDVEWSATASLCEQHAEEFQAWDPSTTDTPGSTTTTTTTTTVTVATTTTAATWSL
ncbi:DUF732 domain-containing protein [Quadrisphaera oryzae]|uniref:DUF732 domain-containing protein n=1 Tax=Quadrisphaera TaxID=317661 RepID=UPI001649062C|nr:DUF732 domain-containing protein [Quadrisphaera sp. RL12-1S]